MTEIPFLAALLASQLAFANAEGDNQYRGYCSRDSRRCTFSRSVLAGAALIDRLLVLAYARRCHAASRRCRHACGNELRRSRRDRRFAILWICSPSFVPRRGIWRATSITSLPAQRLMRSTSDRISWSAALSRNQAQSIARLMLEGADANRVLALAGGICLVTGLP